jgi:hypothetical protein
MKSLIESPTKPQHSVFIDEPRRYTNYYDHSDNKKDDNNSELSS